mgnify:CR=1 FL=1
MAQLEQVLLQQIRLALGQRSDVRLFRNNVGALTDINGRLIRYGLFRGSSDLVGWRTMSGCGCARFLAIEVKAPGPRPTTATPEQVNFLSVVRASGGLAGIARSIEEAESIIDSSSPPTGGLTT